MQPLLIIVDDGDEVLQRSFGMGEIPVEAAIDLFLLEGFHEAFGHGVVIGAGPAPCRLISRMITSFIIRDASKRSPTMPTNGGTALKPLLPLPASKQ